MFRFGAGRALARMLLTLTCAQLCAGAASYVWDLPKGFPVPRVPANNPMSAEKVKLGSFLFYDKRLSANGKMSCASCHRQELAFTDGRAASVGTSGQPHPRSAPSLVNAAYASVLTWNDPGVRTLEAQALAPMFSIHPIELGLRGQEGAILAQFQQDSVYQELFQRAFPEVERARRGRSFTIENVAKALACFVRTIISGRSAYDRFVYERDGSAISESAKRGELLFFTEIRAGCYRCHGGFNFSDATQDASRPHAPVTFHNTGLYNLAGAFSYPRVNLGIYEHTHQLADVGKFKAPTLRNIALTAPYMHDGSIATLGEVIDHYAAGGRTVRYEGQLSEGCRNPNKDPLMKGFELTAQNRVDLMEFLRSLTDEEVIRDKRFSDPW